MLVLKEHMRTLSNKTLRELGLQLGLMAGVMAVAYFFALYLTGAYLFDAFYKFDFWITIPFIVLGIISLRKSADEVKVKHGLIMGLYTVIVCASIIALFYFIFLSYIKPNFIAESLDYRVVLMKNKLSEAIKIKDLTYVKQLNYQLDITLKEQQKGLKPFDMALDRILTNYIVGGIFTLVSAILFRKTVK
jgi:hypothetical protein